MRTWMVLASCLASCGGVEGSGSLTASLEDGTEDKDPGSAEPGDPGGTVPGDKDPGEHEDPGECGGTEAPPVACSDKGLACSVITDKESLCGEGLEPQWDLICGDNEVCCGPAIEEEPGDDPGTVAEK